MDRKIKGGTSVKKVAVDQGAQTEKIEADTARYVALAREHAADLSEEGFNEALKKVAHHKPERFK